MQLMSPRKHPRARRRRARRGVTVFIVIMVIGMLTAIGMFAARSSQLGVTNAGRYRQMTQTHYVAEAGMQGALAEFSRDPDGYLRQLRVSTAPAVASSGNYGCSDIPYAIGTTPASTNCLRLGYQAVEAAHKIRAASSTEALFTPRSGAVPGSFGHANVFGNFSIEFTDERPVEPPPAGMAVGGHGTTMHYKAVTARATGQIFPYESTPGTAVDVTSASDVLQFGHMASMETIRAEVLVGPVP